MVTDQELQTKFKEDSLTLRTEAIFNEHCRGLNGPLRDHFSTTFGVNRNPLLNTLEYFHVMRGLVPDIMHDILEGSLKVVSQQLLQHLIVNKRMLSVQQLNNHIATFTYGPDVTNKPSVIELNHITGHLKQSASQMWCLGRYLPLIVGDLIDEDDPNWDNYLSHLEIVDEMFAPVYCEDRIGYLKMIIEDFLYDFKSLYPNRPLTPKMHYLVHMPTWIKWCGPLMRMWCMRYEAKHSFFKHLSGILRNFKNVSKTLASRHQQYMCYHMMDKDKYLTQPTTNTRSSEVDLVTLDYEATLIASYPSISTANLWSVSSATINGTRYAPNVCVCLDMDSEHMEPSFGIIIQLLVASCSRTLFVLRELETMQWNLHLHAFQVKEKTNVIVLKLDDFIDHHPLKFNQKRKFLVYLFKIFFTGTLIFLNY